MLLAASLGVGLSPLRPDSDFPLHAPCEAPTDLGEIARMLVTANVSVPTTGTHTIVGMCKPESKDFDICRWAAIQLPARASMPHGSRALLSASPWAWHLQPALAIFCRWKGSSPSTHAATTRDTEQETNARPADTVVYTDGAYDQANEGGVQKAGFGVVVVRGGDGEFGTVCEPSVGSGGRKLRVRESAQVASRRASHLGGRWPVGSVGHRLGTALQDRHGSSEAGARSQRRGGARRVALNDGPTRTRSRCCGHK
jgi:hypothetical protein